MPLIIQIEVLNDTSSTSTNSSSHSSDEIIFPNAEFQYVSGNWGNMSLQEVSVNGFVIGRYHFIINRRTKLRISFHSTFAILHFTIQGTTEAINPVKQFPFTELSYGLLDLPHQLPVTVVMHKGRHLWYQLYFSNTLLQKLLDEKQWRPSAATTQTTGPSWFNVVLHIDRRLYNLLQQLNDHLTQSPIHAYYLNGKSMYIIVRFITDATESVQHDAWINKKQNNLRDILSMVEQLFHDEQLHQLSAKSLARKMSVSVYQLKKITKELYHETPASLILKIRMEKALQLLNAGTHNVSQVASRLGYKDLSSFSRAFKSYYGYPPSESKS